MKKSILWASLGLLIACGPSESTNSSGSSSATNSSGGKGLNITIKGSDTVLPVSQKERTRFMELNPEATVQVVGGGSGVGIAALINNTTDIAMVSRDLNYQEKNSLALLGKTTERVVLAYDALAVVVNPGNPMRKLTIKQLELIYTGKVKNWNELEDENGNPGPDMEIIPYSRETSSGTYEYFKEVAMHDREYAPNVLKLPSTQTIVNSVGQNEGAIGYIGVAYINDEVAAVSILNKGTEYYIEPTISFAQDNSYPIVRPLYFFFLQEDTDRLKPFLDFILSEEGQNIIEEVGYVPL
ncbi:MAG: phosphate ABC transporter substrate-binding protein [Bacteroidota bacterium]